MGLGHTAKLSNRKVEAHLPHLVPHLLSALPQPGCSRSSCHLVLPDPGAEVSQVGSEVPSKVEHGPFGF